MRLELYYADNWEALYGDGKLLKQGHKISSLSILTALFGETIESVFTSRIKPDENFNIFPETLEELKKKHEITYGLYFMDFSDVKPSYPQLVKII